MEQRLLILSDLHLGSGWRGMRGTIHAVERQLDGVDGVVINGDLFHGWVRNPKEIVRAIARLRRYVTDHPHIQFYMTDGNHERGNPVAQALQELKSLPNFTHHTNGILLGDTLFLHGDLMFGDGRLRRGDNTRELNLWQLRTHEHGSVRGYMESFAELLMERLHDAQAMPAGGVTIWHEAEEKPLDAALLSHVKRIVYGHTHCKHGALTKDGVEYWNTGAFVEYRHDAPPSERRQPVSLPESGALIARFDGERVYGIEPVAEMGPPLKPGWIRRIEGKGREAYASAAP